MSSYLETRPDFPHEEPRSPLEGKTVLFSFCGSGDMDGGVQKSLNDVAAYMQHHQQMETHVLVGSARSPEEIPIDKQEEVGETPKDTATNTGANLYTTFSSFADTPSNIHVLSRKSGSMQLNGAQNPIFTVVNPRRITREVAAVDPDIMHVMLPMMPHVGGIAVRAAQKNNVPVIGTWHIDADSILTNAGLKAGHIVDRKVLDNIQALIAVSPVAEAHLRRVYDYKGDVEVIPNPIDIDFFANTLPDDAFREEHAEILASESPIMVFVGRPDDRKGLGELIQAFGRIKRSGIIDLQLAVCGYGPHLPKFEALAESEGVGKDTHFLGRVSENRKAMWLHAAQFAVLPAKENESQGITVLEAIAAGTPVIAGNNKGYLSILGNLETSHDTIVNPRDVEALKNRIINLAVDRRLAQEVAANQQSVIGHYDQFVIGKQIAEIYERALAA